jgi:hypothetical protein
MAHPIRFATAPDQGSLTLTEQIIQKRAYELFEKRGCQHGHDIEDWLQAEAEVAGKKPGDSTSQSASGKVKPAA